MSDFASCFVGPEPILVKAGDDRIMVNGAPLRTDFRIISEGNYQQIMKIIQARGIKIDERPLSHI